MATQRFKKFGTSTTLAGQAAKSDNSAVTTPGKELTAERKPEPPKSISIVKERSDYPNDSKYVPHEKIVFHKENKYNQEKLEELAESILNYGLIHNPEAYYDEENDQYILEAGERRTRAIRMLIDRFSHTDDTESYEYECYLKNVKKYEQGIRLSIKRPEIDENGEMTELEKINSLLRIEEANLQIREENPLERAQALQRRKELLQRRNELIDKKSRINVNQKLANENGLGQRTIMKYTAIAEKLIPELQEEFRKNNISLNDGSTYAQLSKTEQECILQMIRAGEKVSKDEIKHLQELMEKHKKLAEEKEAELQKVIAEKKAAEERLASSLSQLEVDRAELAEQIRKEAASQTEAAEDVIIKLQKELEEKNQSHSENERALQIQLKEKNAEMDRISEELQRLKERPILNPEEQRTIHLDLAYKTALKNLQNAAEIAMNAYNELITHSPEITDTSKSLFVNILNRFDLGKENNE